MERPGALTTGVHHFSGDSGHVFMQSRGCTPGTSFTSSKQSVLSITPAPHLLPRHAQGRAGEVEAVSAGKQAGVWASLQLASVQCTSHLMLMLS